MRYIQALDREASLLTAEIPALLPLKTLYLGGGTPSLLSPDLLNRLMDSLSRYFQFTPQTEITLEANPEDVSRELAGDWAALGINRLSLGFQSMEDSVLRTLGRRNSARSNLHALEYARESGITNISADIILSVPGMDLSRSLDPMLTLGLSHLSAYSLSIEEGSLLIKEVDAGRFHPLSEDDSLEQYRQALDSIEASGLARYEISNFAREPRLRSRHNTNYWDYGTWYALGLGAFGCLDAPFRRVQNHVTLPAYYASLEQGELPRLSEEILDVPTRIREYLMLGLRRVEGIDPLHFREKFSHPLEDFLYPEDLSGLSDVEYGPDRLRLTSRGLEVADPLISEIWDHLHFS